jgi:ATP-dependent Clp protease protease subunit
MSKVNVPTSSKMKVMLEDFAQANPKQFSKILSQVTGKPIKNGRYMPSIVTESNGSRFSMDPFSYMLNERVVFYTGAVDEQTSELAKVQLLYLEAVDKVKDISLYIDSPGGEVYRGNGMIDTMHFILPDVNAIVCGMAISMGAMTLVNGTPGKRFSTLNSRIMIHQPLSGGQGQMTENAISTKEGNDLKIALLRDIAKKAGVSFAECVLACERDNYMSPREALEFGEFGLIDGIIVDRRAEEEGGVAKPIIAKRDDAILDEYYPDLKRERKILKLLLQKENGLMTLGKKAESEKKKRNKRIAEEKAKAEAEAAQQADDDSKPE